MGDDIECCVRPNNLGKKDLKTYRGIKPKINQKVPSIKSDNIDNFGSFKKSNNSNKNSDNKGNLYLNSIYESGKESKFPNFAEFEIEPVSEPLHDEQISQHQPKYENAQYIESNPTIPQQNQIIQDTHYINSNNQYSIPQIQSENIQYIQPELGLNSYANNIQSNYIENNTQEYTNNLNINSQPIEYISSTPDENLVKQYGNTHNILPTKYIQIQKPIIYSNNDNQISNEYIQPSFQNYVESPSSNQQYEQYNYDNSIPQYYESKIENKYIPSNPSYQYVQEVSTPQSNNFQYSTYISQNSYIESPQQIYSEQNVPQIYIDKNPKIEEQEYIRQQNNDDNKNWINKKEIRNKNKGPADNSKKKPKKMKRRKKKIIEYYSEDEEEEEEEEEDDDINNDSEEEEEREEKEQNSSSNEEIEDEPKKGKKLLIKKKKKHIHKNKEKVKKKKKNKKSQKQNIKSKEEKEQKKENINNAHEKEIDVNKIMDKKEKQNEEEFSGFQKEPELLRESFEDNTIENFDDIYGDRMINDLRFKDNKKEEKQIISLKNGDKIEGNFKKEAIEEKRNEMVEKEREDLFCGKTLKVASVEKKEENTGCQVPGFISSIFSKIF